MANLPGSRVDTFERTFRGEMQGVGLGIDNHGRRSFTPASFWDFPFGFWGRGDHEVLSIVWPSLEILATFKLSSVC